MVDCGIAVKDAGLKLLETATVVPWLAELLL